MKQLLTVLLCLLLCGCAPKADTASPETAPETQAMPENAGMTATVHPLEEAYPGLIRAYSLPLQNVHGIRTFDSDVLVLSGTGSTTLTLLTGEELQKAAEHTLDFFLSQDDPSLRIHSDLISFYDPTQQVTVLLDQQLREVRRIAVPAGLSGKPILSADAKTLFYCTEWSVVSWDLETGIRRTVKEFIYDGQELTGLHHGDQILECTVTDGTVSTKLFLSAVNGTETAALKADAQVRTGDSGYFAAIPEGFQTVMLFSRENSSTELLLPKTVADHSYYLKADHAVVTATTAPEGIFLDYYELSAGILRTSLVLDKLQTLKSIAGTQNHDVYILAYDPAADCDMLYRWDVLGQAPDNTASYVATYHSIAEPDTEALEQCREYARSIGDIYGITVQVWEDACDVQPWDYRFDPEYLAPVLMKELKLLEQRLARYPEGMLEKTASHFTGLTLCLVREITGTGESTALQTPTGIQFFEENHAYVVITTGKYSQQALYHELYHVMDTHILTESVALDQWEALNPGGFSYGGSHGLPEDADIYLQGQTRAFVDSYSMTYPKEDRARILEQAMLPGNADTFRSEYMQRKLTALCQGIRDAYRLKKHPEVLPWEQYLVTPLVPET